MMLCKNLICRMGISCIQLRLARSIRMVYESMLLQPLRDAARQPAVVHTFVIT